MSLYYAKVVVQGTTTPQKIHVEASSIAEAKRLIEERIGKVGRFVLGPVAASKPPSWYS